VKVSRMLRGGERDSWSGGSACMAVIYILGAIIGRPSPCPRRERAHQPDFPSPSMRAPRRWKRTGMRIISVRLLNSVQTLASS
jgi:hypothetical protein